MAVKTRTELRQASPSAAAADADQEARIRAMTSRERISAALRAGRRMRALAKGKVVGSAD